MLRSMPVFLLALIGAMFLGFSWIPIEVRSAMYGLSLSLKSVILFVLPFLVFTLLFQTCVRMSNGGVRGMLAIVICVCVSNFVSTMVSFGVGSIGYQFDLTFAVPSESSSLAPNWFVTLPQWVSTGKAMIAALILGLGMRKWFSRQAERLTAWFELATTHFFRFFPYALPPFIAGFIIKMLHDGTIGMIAREFGLIFVLFAVAVGAYIVLLYLVAYDFRVILAWKGMQNMLGASFVGFGSMSSAAALPLSILGIEQNTNKSGLGALIAPATVNNHLIGDCLAIPVFALAILKGYGMAFPSFEGFVIFALFFVLAKFSVAAVPGGGILVMLPLLEAHFGFNAEMLSLITALYVLFDPIITAMNVFGNGAFALLVGKRVRFLKNNLA